MQSLKSYVQESMIQPEEIGHQNDGLFQMIEQCTNLSIVQNAKTREDRINKAISSSSKRIEKEDSSKS